MKNFLHEAFLAEKQQYLRDVLAMKMFMADFIDTDAGKPQRQQHQQPKTNPVGTGAAFVSPKKKTFPVYHA